MLGRFLLGAVVGPALVIGLAYAYAFPGWALLLIAGPFVLAIIYGASRANRPLAGSTAASRTDRRLEPSAEIRPLRATLRGRLSQHRYRLTRK